MAEGDEGSDLLLRAGMEMKGGGGNGHPVARGGNESQRAKEQAGKELNRGGTRGTVTLTLI